MNNTMNNMNINSNDVTGYGIFANFFKKHPDVTFGEIMELYEAVRIYQRIDGKTIHDISNVKHTNDVYKIASELEIFRYKDYHVPLLRRMIIDKFHSIFSTQECNSDQIITNAYTEEFFIQAPLLLGPPYEITINDEVDFSECVPDSIIEFKEENNDELYTIPKESSVYDFMCPMIRDCYKKMYRCLKYYKAKYYRYVGTEWILIDSLDDVTKELFIVICNNTRTLNNDLEKMYLYIERNDKFKQKLRKLLTKNMVKTVKTYSELDMSMPLDTVPSLDNTIEQSNSSSSTVEETVVSIKRQKKDSPPVTVKNMTRYFS